MSALPTKGRQHMGFLYTPLSRGLLWLYCQLPWDKIPTLINIEKGRFVWFKVSVHDLLALWPRTQHGEVRCDR